MALADPVNFDFGTAIVTRISAGGVRSPAAISVRADDHGQVAVSGVHNAPGTHAPVFSDAFLVVGALDLL